jgi:adenylate kinase family enzyme
MVHIDVPGYEKKLYIADPIHANLQKSKIAVLKKGWDYVCIVSGIPGVGKSTFAQALAKYLDPDFESKQICFTAKEFKDKTSVGEKGQAFILDESFADMNSNLSRSPEFIALVNHLQLIRQRNLFIILVLPDFFSLAKNIAIFRSNHLFVPYSVDYARGDVAVFDREAKRELYIKGKIFINYQASPPNFRTDYQGDWFCDLEDYLARKTKHLQELAQVKEKGAKAGHQRDILAALLHEKYKSHITELCGLVRASDSTVYGWIERGKVRIDSLKPPKSDF